MERECCQIKITELDDGYRIEVTGDDLKERCNCWQVLQQCCGTQQKATTDDK